MVPNFRVWDIIAKRYYSVETWHMEDEYVDLIESNKSTADPNAKRFWRRISEVILEQSTGLKDVNGKEIYEGDIIHAIREDSYDRTGKILFEEGAYVVDNGMDKCLINPMCGEFIILKIIGNVHENPELLEAQHDTRTD